MKARRLALAAVCGAAITAGIPVPSQAGPAAKSAPTDVTVQLLSITDFHSGTPMPSQVAGLTTHYSDGRDVPYVGTEYLANALRLARGSYKNTITWSNGDNFTSYNFYDKGNGDEFGLEKYKQLGMEFYVVGNHDLDWRVDHLRNQLNSKNPCPTVGFLDCQLDSTGHVFDGISSPAISSNIVWTKSGKNVWQSYQIRQFKQNGRTYKVGIIGATVMDSDRWPMSYNEQTTTLERIGAINKASDELAAKGVDAQVLSIHDGASDTDNFADTCVKVTGPAVDVAKRVSPRISVVISGHTHKMINCTVPGPDGTNRPFVQAGSYGVAYSQVLLTLDGRTGKVKADKTVSNLVPVTKDVPADPKIVAMNDYWPKMTEQRAHTVIATTNGDITLDRTDAGEHALGDVAADALLWSSKQKGNPKADLALVSTANGADQSGWNSLTHGPITGVKQADGTLGIEYQNAFEAFGHDHKIITASFTGQQLVSVLEQQWRGDKFYPLAVSKNVRYSYWASNGADTRVNSSQMTINGQRIDLTRTYRVAIPAGDYATGGRNSNTALTQGTNPQVHERLDEQVLVEYLRAMKSITVPTLDRVTKLP